MAAENLETDVVIVGAGMVGSQLAALLKNSGLRVLLLERSAVSEPQKEAPFEPRVSALTRASENLLRHAGAWAAIKNHRACEYTNMQVWDADGSGRVQFSARELGEPHLGVLVENSVLQWALTQAAVQSACVTLRCPAQVIALERMPQHWQLTLADGEKISAKLVVGADGAQSAVRQLAGIAVTETNYAQRAIVTTVRCEKNHGHTAWQRFMRSGPLAFLPLQTQAGDNHFCSIVWSQDEAEAQRLLALNTADFQTELGAAFEHTLGNIEWADARFSFPLRAAHAKNYGREGIALIGDAAHAIHPLAGQGVNLGLLDAAVLAEEILRAQARGIAWWGEQTLERYSRRRRAHNTVMLGSMSALQKLFGSAHPAAVLLRNAGMNLTQQLLPVKQEFARVAMGMAGDLPAAAQNPP